MVRSRSIVGLTLAISATVLLIAGAVSYRSMQALTRATAALVQSKDTALALEHSLSVLRDAETGQRGYLLTQSPEYLEPYQRALTDLEQRFVELEQLYSGDSPAQDSLRALRTLAAAKTAELARTIELARGDSADAALALVSGGEGKRSMDAIRSMIETMEGTEDREIERQLRLESDARRAAGRSVLALTGLALVILAVLVYVTRRAGARIRESEQRLGTTLHSIGDAVIATDDQGRVQLMNPVAETLTGWDQAAAAGRHLDEVFRIVNEHTGAIVDSPAAKVLRDGVVVGLANHTLLIGRDGTRTPIEDSAAPIAAQRTGILGVVLVFRDATAARSAERALLEADRRKDEFLAVLAHELRNPLAPIRQAAVIARTPAATEAQVRWSHDVIDRQVGHMSRLLDDLLDVSRITRGTLEVRRSRVELSSVVDAAIEMARPLIDVRRHALDVDLPREPLPLDADPLRLAQAIGNLLTNAAKYTEPGGEIKLVAQRDGDAVAVQIVDNGIGLTPESLARIFEMFVQIAPPLDRAEAGLGIGLALAKGLVELHGGAIAARSAGPGQGSEFTVRLPLAAAGAPGAAQTPAAPEPAAPPPIPASKRSQTGLRIVVADDNRDAATSLAALLELESHRVEVVHDGPHALYALERSRPDVGLLDVGMPELNGYEVARRARAEPWGNGLTLVAITGWGQQEDRDRALDAGFDQHWVKPIDPGAALALCARIAAQR
ncbi:MAG TPA: CHASE3 domain-containing protein [Gammaproteobacteria bacterium]|nr:CHASE3 domain-containing protein [Gammaproteobacteria bacterium]